MQDGSSLGNPSGIDPVNLYSSRGVNEISVPVESSRMIVALLFMSKLTIIRTIAPAGTL